MVYLELYYSFIIKNELHEHLWVIFGFMYFKNFEFICVCRSLNLLYKILNYIYLKFKCNKPIQLDLNVTRNERRKNTYTTRKPNPYFIGWVGN